MMASKGDEFGRRNFSAPVFGPKKPRKTFVLLFDGTGNKFSGEDGDSNVLKILRMLDRNDSSQIHYYQPGIGTYVHSKTYSHTSVFTRMNSWLQKTRDSAIGTSFDIHVMGGYTFLMKYYETGDDIFFFGFSRGAYIARFLAEMLDYVGLLEPGNEEMARFAWKAFAQWQMRLDKTEEEKAKKKKMFKYLSAFRDTFSRPVRRIRFLGLFDTVNSVPRFENAWMQRSKFPYTAKSSALVIRHAVGIDERRAKFRQDLISEHTETIKAPRGRVLEKDASGHLKPADKTVEIKQSRTPPPSQRYRRKSHVPHHFGHHRDASPAPSMDPVSEKGAEDRSLHTVSSNPSLRPIRRRPTWEAEDDDDEDEDLPQDIREIWFPGCHADIGGGWPLTPGEDLPLSHGPLVWMVREARKAGLRFDEEKMVEMRCLDPNDPTYEKHAGTAVSNVPGAEHPTIRVESPATEPSEPKMEPNDKSKSVVRKHVHTAATKGVMHDCLEYGQGLSRGGVVGWKIMEYLPFRRMDLLADNSWRSIRWPLPKGEVRDVPSDAVIHYSAIRRIEADPHYRPGNIIVGGGGRGTRKAPAKYGTGEWEVVREAGDPIGECVVRKIRPEEWEEIEKAEEKRQREEKESAEKAERRKRKLEAKQAKLEAKKEKLAAKVAGKEKQDSDSVQNGSVTKEE